MTALDLETLATGLQTRAGKLARSLAERNPIVIERAADEFDASLLATERESSARTLEQDFRYRNESRPYYVCRSQPYRKGMGCGPGVYVP